jgi:alpha-tubulin suppressor-like RCC1 family protein
MMLSCKCLGMESQVVAMAGVDHTLIVNGKGELYITSEIPDTLSNIYRDKALEPQSTLKLIFSQPTANRILQISTNFHHAAFVTKTGQVTKSFMSLNHGIQMNVKP